MADVGHGATIVFATSGFIAEVVGMEIGDMSRESYDTTHLHITDGFMTFMPGDLVNPGTLTLEILYNPDQASGTSAIPIRAEPEIITITYAKPAGASTGAQLYGVGFVTSASHRIEQGLMTATIAIKWTGKLTFVNAA